MSKGNGRMESIKGHKRVIGRKRQLQIGPFPLPLQVYPMLLTFNTL